MQVIEQVGSAWPWSLPSGRSTSSPSPTWTSNRSSQYVDTVSDLVKSRVKLEVYKVERGMKLVSL